MNKGRHRFVIYGYQVDYDLTSSASYQCLLGILTAFSFRVTPRLDGDCARVDAGLIPGRRLMRWTGVLPASTRTQSPGSLHLRVLQTGSVLL